MCRDHRIFEDSHGQTTTSTIIPRFEIEDGHPLVLLPSRRQHPAPCSRVVARPFGTATASAVASEKAVAAAAFTSASSFDAAAQRHDGAVVRL